jgi:anaerobic selenocysteine-containing dehydrogenase
MPTHYRTCNLCEAMCGIAIQVEGGRIVSIRGDADDPFSRGHICPKAVALQDVHEDPDRLRRPLRRRGRDWEEISWDEALAEASERLAAVQKEHGREAVAVYQGNPTVHNYGAALFGQVFLRSLGTRSRFSATSVDQLPQMLASLLMFGHQLLLPVPDIDRTRLFLVFGANPLASNGSLMTAPGVERRLKEMRARGGRLIVVDPRRTETAALADRHVPIRPGSDALLLLALLQVVFAEGLARPGRLASFTDGLDDVEKLAAPFTPESVADATGVPAAVTRELAREFAAASPAVAYGRVGVSMQEFGGLASWLINVLNVATGNLDRPGGAMFTLPAVDLVDLAARVGQRGHFDKGRSRVRGLPEFGGEYPAAVLAEEIETPGPGQIRALVTSAGNPVLSTPNGGRLERALAGLDYMVSIDIYLNETTRHAHLILPPTDALEHDLYDVVFHVLAVRNTAKYSPALFEPAPAARHDWQIFLELSRRVDAAKGRGGWKRRLTQAALRRLGPSGLLGLLLRMGPYGLRRGPWRGLSLGRLRRDVHGVDLGALEPCLPDRLYSRGKRIGLAPERFVRDLERLRPRLQHAPNGLLLIGRRDLRSNNSWMHNSERLVKGRDRCTLLMHPQDAERRALADGQRVRVSSRVGSVTAALEVTADVMPGVVCLPHGWGHHREGTRLGVAGARPGASFNDLSDDQAVDALCGTARFSATPVEVAAAAPLDRQVVGWNQRA